MKEKVFSNHQDRRDRQKSKLEPGQLVRTADTKKELSRKGTAQIGLINYTR